MSETCNNVYFVAGGGTGGHIYPALAIADELSKSSKVYYVGNKRNMEYSLATKKGYKFLHVSIKGMPRTIGPKLFIWGIKLVRAILYSIKYIKKYKPKAVFATGGYVSAPIIFACIITKTPYMMHDCDAMPGLVSRRLSKRAKCVSLAFENAKRHIPNRNTIITGNPIREAFSTMTKDEARRNLGLQNKTTICIMGGSQGAKSINYSAIDLIKEFSQNYDLQIIFQTGAKNFDEISEKLNLIYPNWKNDKNLLIKPYFDDMISVLKSSDIAVSRAGSLSISEICASNCVPILIPYPYAASNHQRINAKSLLNSGACVYIEDSDLDANRLKEELFSLLQNSAKFDYIRQNASILAKYDASKNIAGKVLSL